MYATDLLGKVENIMEKAKDDVTRWRVCSASGLEDPVQLCLLSPN